MFVQIQWCDGALDKLAKSNTDVSEFLSGYQGEGDYEKNEDITTWSVDIVETGLAVVAIEAMRHAEGVGVMTFVDGAGYKIMTWS